MFNLARFRYENKFNDKYSNITLTKINVNEDNKYIVAYE